jgi:hypothetical protein
VKTLLISGTAAPPPELRDVVERGSTVLRERRAAEIDTADAARLDADRLVFWAPQGDAAVRALARSCARAERDAGRETIVFVTPETDAAPIEGLTAAELFIWPRDRDRLTMAFMTGA